VLRREMGETPPQEPLPHRALSLNRVIEYNREILQEFAKEDLEGPNTFPKWDKAKRLIRTHAKSMGGQSQNQRQMPQGPAIQGPQNGKGPTLYAALVAIET
jgi:hypothetical protein